VAVRAERGGIEAEAVAAPTALERELAPPAGLPERARDGIIQGGEGAFTGRHGGGR